MPRKTKTVADAPKTVSSPDIAADSPMPDKLAIAQRLARLGVWAQISPLRDQMMKEARAQGLSKEEAQRWVYGELDRLYPAEVAKEAENRKEQEQDEVVNPGTRDNNQGEGGSLNQGTRGNGQGEGGARPATPTADEVVAHAREIAARGRVIGLDAIPAEWPALPASAPLAAELAWCQANRLACVSEPPNGAVRVDLTRAAESAPSRSALAWLETSIRNYSKFTDVLAKVASGTVDEGEDARRERASLLDIERLLDYMACTV